MADAAVRPRRGVLELAKPLLKVDLVAEPVQLPQHNLRRLDAVSRTLGVQAVLKRSHCAAGQTGSSELSVGEVLVGVGVAEG